MAHLSLVSLYSGAGGLDYGFEAAGFDVRAAVEMDADSVRTLAGSRCWPVLDQDIHHIPTRQILDTANLRVGDVDLLLGGPPCQPFSKSGYWALGDTARLDDPRASTLHAYMRCVADLLPKAFVMENVPGIAYEGKDEGFRFVEDVTQHINQQYGTRYTIHWKVLNACEYGVPQLRERFFLVADRRGRVFSFPEPTHALPPSCAAGTGASGAAELRRASRGALPIVPGLRPPACAWDAIGGLLAPDCNEDLAVRGNWADLLPSIPEGENYLWHTSRGGGMPLFGWRTRYWSFLLKLAKNRPAWTIQAQPGPAVGPFHWCNRLLSVREMAAIQTFPSNVQFFGTRRSVQRQIGNAVPALLAEVIAREVATQLFGSEFQRPLTLSIPPLRPVPPAERLAAVPARFLPLAGQHDDHPGTGKGRAAVARSVPEARTAVAPPSGARQISMLDGCAPS